MVRAQSLVLAPPAANLDQVRNGSAGSPVSPGNWVNGNAGSSQAHYIEGLSAPYRVVMTDMPLSTNVTIVLGYDIKHSDRHAIDYLTHYDRLEPHLLPFGHAAEDIDPLLGVSGVSMTIDTEPIPIPDTTNSPVPGQPATSFNALPPGERVMTLFGGNIVSVAYAIHGDLTASQSETQISVTFSLDSATAVLAWGGHIGSRTDWGNDGMGVPRSAGGISGSPYHMRLISWTLGNLGQQDRSLSAGAVLDPCAGVTCAGPTGPCDAGQACNSETGNCEDLPDPAAGTSCEADGSLCTIDQCDGAGMCATISTVSCQPASPPCEAGQLCNPATGQCEAQMDAPLSTPCERDGNLCTVDHCDGNGACVTFDNVMCAGSSNPCDAGEQCDPGTGMCVTLMQPPVGTPCEADSNLCTLDACDGMGNCVFDENVTCPPSEACADYVCDPGTGTCDFTPKPLSTPCNTDGNLCTIDHCDGLGNCVPLDTVSCPDPGQCNSTMCNPMSGSCDVTPLMLSTPCELDADLCTIDHCDGAGMCVPLDAVDCSELNDQCNDAVCDPMTGDCDVMAKPLSTPCERDGNPCTIDHCDGDGSCVALDFVDCPTGTPPCDAGQACDPSSGTCVDLPDPPDGTPCDDILFCNGHETCLGGVCDPGIPPCDDGDPCTTDSCDESADACNYECPTPGITCPPNLTFECDDVGEFGDPMVDDSCGINTVVECTEQSTPGKLPQEQIIIRTCTVTNNCGNMASCEHRIDIVDTTPPEVTCPPDLTFECDAIGDYGDPVVTDNCDPDPNITVEVEEIIGDCTQQPMMGVAGISVPPKLTVVRTITSEDGGETFTVATGSPNSAQCVQRIDIIDSTPPQLHDCPAEVLVCAGHPPFFTPPTCTDNCGDCMVNCVRSDGQPLDAPVDGPIVITCTSTDECLNVSAPCDIQVLISTTGDCFVPIPTVSEWGLVVLALLMLIGGKVYFARSHEQVA